MNGNSYTVDYQHYDMEIDIEAIRRIIRGDKRMPSKKHVHKYEHVSLGNGKVWACALRDGCNHHMPAHMSNLVIGRRSICWNCDDEFILNANSIECDRPICKECSGLTSIESILEQKLGVKS